MAIDGRFTTALREETRKRIEKIDSVDIVVGIPAYYSDASVAHVIRMVIDGLEAHYPDKKALIIVSDGGSTDDTREVAKEVVTDSFMIDTMVIIYRGVPGKGTAFRAIFEAAYFLKAKALALFDSDLKSITGEWVKRLIDPVLDGSDFVAPDYYRYKFDGTITNTLAFNLTRTLYGANIRQPIGGDFGVSLKLVKYYLDQEVWESDIAKFGIDIWMTTTALVGDFEVCQAKLGAKIHGEKDPAADLTPMFRQVVGTIFLLMELHEEYWKKVKKTREIKTIGSFQEKEPDAFEINQDTLIDYFKLGHQNFKGIWEDILETEDFAIVEELVEQEDHRAFNLPVESWVRIVFRYASRFHATPRQRFKLLDTMIPLYHARVATIVNDLEGKSTKEAEAYYESQAQVFERMRDYLHMVWNHSTEG